jgi:acetyltransferase-like isoleucine patch superfamily enzyme
VVKDVEPWTVVAGNPARVIKKRTLSASSGERVG